MGSSPVQHDHSITPTPLAPSLREVGNLRKYLPELVSLRQWVCWVLEPRVKADGSPVLTDTGRPKMGKAPRRASNGHKAEKNNPEHWSDFETALDQAKRLAAQYKTDAGVGFVFTSDTPFAAIDADDALDEDMAVTPLAGETLDLFPRCYTEISPSGKGLRLVVRGKPTRDRNGQKLGLEVYGHRGYTTLTGAVYGGRTELREAQAGLDALEARFFPEAPMGEHKEGGQGRGQENERAQPPAVSLTLDDEAVLRRARSAKNGPKFQALEAGVWGAAGFGSPSEADLSFCQLLAFYTKDAAQIDRLFRASGLMRDKWNEQHGEATYGAITVQKALETSTGTYSGRGERKERQRPTASEHKERRGETEAPAAAPRVMDRDTHGANAERLAGKHAHELRYVPGLGWLYFNGRVWEANEPRAKVLAAGVARYVEAEAVDLSRQAAQAPSEAAAKPLLEAAKALRKWRRRCEMVDTVMGTLALADDRLALDAAELDRCDALLNVQNGTLNLETGELRPHDPADFLTQIAAVAYDPEADCPHWLGFVEEVMPDPATRRELQKLAGYTLSGDISEQKMAFFYGTGSNGKSTYLEVIQRLLGKGYARQAAPNLLMASNVDKHTTDRAALRGARLVVASEAEQERRFAVQTLKELTGETHMTARLIQRDNLTFPIHFKICLMANHRPDVRDNTHSLWRRLLMFPFTVRFDRPDTGLREALLGELPGVLNWCLEGYRLWRSDGGLAETPAMAALKSEYRKEEDDTGRFLEERCARGEGPDFREQTSSLYAAYCAWAEGQGGKPMKQKPFNEALDAAGLEYHKTKGPRYWRGVRLRGAEEL